MSNRTPKTALPAATKLPPALHAEAEKTASATGLRMADLLRIGLARVLSEYRETGKIVLTKPTTKAAR